MKDRKRSESTVISGYHTRWEVREVEVINDRSWEEKLEKESWRVSFDCPLNLRESYDFQVKMLWKMTELEMNMAES